MTLYVLIYRTV